MRANLIFGAGTRAHFAGRKDEMPSAPEQNGDGVSAGQRMEECYRLAEGRMTWPP